VIHTAEIYFIHGTAIDNRVWSNYVKSSISKVFAPNMTAKITLFDWCGSNNSGARSSAAQKLIRNLEQKQKEDPNWKPKSITFVGHSHGGTILLMASGSLRNVIHHEVKINFLTLNTPNVVGGPTLENSTINHYHVYCKTDLVTPRAGFSRTGVLLQGGEKRNLFGKPIGGEYSSKKDLESSKVGTVIWEFEEARANINYIDQYRFRGINPRSHFVSHRGWLEKNVKQWLPLLSID
jgi:hypothetical protein